MSKIEDLTDALIEELSKLDETEKIEKMNAIKKRLHEISPFKSEPVDCVIWIPSDHVFANDYNPNRVANPEMELLHTSIKEDGYTQPVVACDLQAVGEAESEHWEVVDGFHRNRVGKEHLDIAKRIHGYLPVSLLVKTRKERIAATIRHNRARGTHQIRLMSDIVMDLTRYGYSDNEICQQLGMELDEVIRLKQITGLKEAFQNHEFSRSWEEFESNYYDEKTEL